MNRNVFLIVAVLTIVTCTSPILAQRIYVDLTGCNYTPNSYIKPGWGIDGAPNFRDEFNVDIIVGYTTGSQQCSASTYADRWQLVQSDFNWLWRWDPNGWGDEPFYYSLNNFDQDVVDDVLPYNLDNKCLKLRVTSSESGFQYPDPPTPTTILQYPVTKFYEASTILTSQLDNCVWNAAPIQDERTFTYGWFEIRCKLPTAKYSWPGFWLFGGGDDYNYNEIDCFELGSNDIMTHTTHWENANTGIQYGLGQYTYTIPGQTYGGQWVTYAVKWEPNKVIWYINNANPELKY